MTDDLYVGTGTQDFTSFITVPEGRFLILATDHLPAFLIKTGLRLAIAFRQWLGGEKAIYDYCHTLAVDGARRLAEVLGGTRVLDESGELTTTMVRGAFAFRSVQAQITKLMRGCRVMSSCRCRRRTSRRSTSRYTVRSTRT